MNPDCACPTRKTLSHTFHVLPCLCLCAGFAITASSQPSPSPKAPPVLNGTVFATSLKHTLNAGKLKAGDKVEFDSIAPTLIGNSTVVPGNAVFHGHVLIAEAADKESKRESRLSVVVDSVTWKNRSVPLCASIVGFGSRAMTVEAPTPAVGYRSDSVRPVDGTNTRNMHMPEGTYSPLDVFARAAPLSDLMAVPPQKLVIGWQSFVGDVEIRSPGNSPSVLSRKKKNLSLPGGLIVGLQQLQPDACAVSGGT